MNDPRVEALIYRVEHKKTKSFDKVKPLRDCRSPEFDLTVEDNVARFEFKKFYANVTEALKAVKPFIEYWEFEADMEGEPDCFKLWYERAEIVDRNPLPPELRPAPLQASAVASFEVELSVSAPAKLYTPHYPSPPAGGSVDLDDADVAKMKGKYDQYRSGQEKLPVLAYFCITVLEDKYGGLPAAAKECGVSKKVLEKIKRLSSTKGGKDARKGKAADYEFTPQEKQFLNLAIPKIIIRAAQVAADDSQRHPQITMADLPSL